MSEDTVVALSQPGQFDDPLSGVLREGARRLLAQAIEAEVETLFAEHADLCTADGRRRLVRHGHGPERQILTGIGPVAVRRATVRDRGGRAEDRIRFSSAILPAFARHRRCWMHKTANVLNKPPKALQTAANTDIHEIWMAAGRADATAARSSASAS